MSIPKEPRQLMINVMYLVLTAMLALNVSAEVFNAFKLVDKGLVKSNEAMDSSNNQMKPAIDKAAKAKASFSKYADRVDGIRDISSSLTSYIEGIKDTMINATGGYVPDRENPEIITDDLKGKKDFDVTTRLLVGDPQPDGTVIGKGEELKAKLNEYKEKILEFIDEEDREAFKADIAVSVDDQTWQDKGKASWSHMNFDHMPLQATLPLFSKYINDVKSTESAALNYLGKKVGIGKEDVVLDKFTVVSAPEKSYVIKGDKYKAQVFLTAFAGGDSKTQISISVDGRKMPLDKDGKATFEQTATTTGSKKYNAVANVFNPVTGKTDTYKQQFSYEVGERSVAISATKMNVFYIGVDNPVEVSAAGVNSNNMKVSMAGAGGASIKKAGDGTFIVTATRPTKKGEFAKINVSADGMTAGKDFRVKRIPDPVPKLSKHRGGALGSGEFKIQPGVFPVLDNFDFDAKCNITGYRVVRVPKRQDPQISENPGGKFNAQSKSVIGKASPGDRYFFENIKCKCPGDQAARDIGGMVFAIK